MLENYKFALLFRCKMFYIYINCIRKISCVAVYITLKKKKDKCERYFFIKKL
jgi:hypothetical protein